MLMKIDDSLMDAPLIDAPLIDNSLIYNLTIKLNLSYRNSKSVSTHERTNYS